MCRIGVKVPHTHVPTGPTAQLNWTIHMYTKSIALTLEDERVRQLIVGDAEPIDGEHAALAALSGSHTRRTCSSGEWLQSTEATDV